MERAHHRTPLNIGDPVSIDWNLKGRRTYHVITGIRIGERSQSGILYHVEPQVHPKSPHDREWIDHDWFRYEGMPPQRQGLEDFME